MVEMILVLPMLLIFVAMITLVGTTGSWRVRAHANARQGAMRAVWPRTTGSDPNPIDWPRGDASIQRVGGNDISPQDPYAVHTAVRGPVYLPTGGGGGGTLRVDSQVMDPRGGISNGRAQIDRAPALWGRSGFRTRMVRDFPILGNASEAGNGARWGRALYGIRFD